MSDTPRTDDEQFGATGRVSVDFARTLERELTAAQARIAELEKRLTSSERARQSLSDACDSLQAEIRELKAELAKLNDPVATTAHSGFSGINQMTTPFQPGERVEVRQNEGTLINGEDASNLLFYATVVRCVDATHQINGIEVKDDDGETFYVDWRELRRVEK